MKRTVVIAGVLIVSIIILAGAWIGVPQVLGSGSRLIAPSASDVSAARWQALGEAYAARMSKPVMSAADVSAARWQALGEAYSLRGAKALSASDIDAARWQALGEAYLARMAEKSDFTRPPVSEFKGNR